MRKNWLFVILILACAVGAFSQSYGVLFRFKFSKDDQSRILSTVEEDVYVNGRLNHKATILNRISSNITETADDGSGTCQAVFMTSDEYFMPTVRDVPVFPEKPVKKGEKWTFEGHEAHDLRMAFGIQKPFKVPFTANYQYLDDEYDEKSGRIFNVIEVKYDFYFESPTVISSGYDFLKYPKVTMGHSTQKLWWDNERGMIDHYSETFRIIIETFQGDKITFSGTAHAEVNEFNRSSTEENIRKIKDFVGDSGIENVEVTSTDRGVTISVEKIQFEPDSSRLMESEKEKLRKIAQILKQFDNDLLITGHCADRGSRKNQQKISEDRAISVAEFLSQQNIRNPNCIFTQGKALPSQSRPIPRKQAAQEIAVLR